MRRAGVGSTNYNIAINSHLPSRDAILKNKHHKRQLSLMLSAFDMGVAFTIDTQDTGVFRHEEAEVTIISYVLQAVGSGNNVVRILCEDTDVFVLLVFWMWRNQLVDKCQLRMERYSASTRHARSYRLQMSSVAWHARLNWLRHYILPIQQRQGIGPECPWNWIHPRSLPCPRGGRRHAMGPSGGWTVILLCTIRPETRHTHGRSEI